MGLNNKTANKMSTETCAVDDANVAGASPLHTPGSAHTARALPVLQSPGIVEDVDERTMRL